MVFAQQGSVPCPEGVVEPGGLRFVCENPEQTAAFARRLAGLLRAGDTVLLSGPVGAGKTHFARALIQSLLLEPEDVPSPTFALVQVYQAAEFEIFHADLYRLSSPDEIEELGLSEAFGAALCLIEWPDRLGVYRPATALALEFVADAGDYEREITIRAPGEAWTARLRELADV